MLTPVDLETMVFKRSFRGFDIKEIREFMSRITKDYETLYRENLDLKEDLELLKIKLSQYQSMEENIRNAVILAQKTADEVKTSAQLKSEMIVQEAIQQSEEVKVKLREDIQNELQNLALLKNQAELFKSQFKGYLNSLLEIVDNQADLGKIWEGLHNNLPKEYINAAQEEAAATDEKNNEEMLIDSDKEASENNHETLDEAELIERTAVRA